MSTTKKIEVRVHKSASSAIQSEGAGLVFRPDNTIEASTLPAILVIGEEGKPAPVVYTEEELETLLREANIMRRELHRLACEHKDDAAHVAVLNYDNELAAL